MACFHPKWAWQVANSGKAALSFSHANYTSRGSPDFEIPCGKCEACRAAHAKDWGIRCWHESLMHSQNCMITFTYDDQHLPADGKIDKHELQVFNHRLRRLLKSPIRYLACGEYGDKSGRAHYHMLLFGRDLREGSDEIKPGSWLNPAISKAWGKGNVQIDELTDKSAFYVAGYVNKKIGDKDTFAIMSTKPPIGRTWVIQNHDNLRRLESVQINGKSHPIPKAYLAWLKGIEDFEHLAENRRQNAVTRTDKQLRNKRLNMLAQKSLRSESI